MGQHGAASLNCSSDEATTPLLQLECMQVGCSHTSYVPPPSCGPSFEALLRTSPQAASLDDLLSLNTDFFFFPPAAVLDGVALTQLPEQAVAEGKLNAREVS